MYNITCLDSYGKSVTRLTQWDINQTLIVEGLGLDYPPTFHFCNRKSQEALVVESKFSDTKSRTLAVKIPNILLEEAESITAFIYAYDTNTGEAVLSSAKTIAVIELPVTKRVKPSDYRYVENVEYVSVAAIKTDMMRRINNQRLECDENNNDYTITLYNSEGIKISECELPVSNMINDINTKINNYSLTSENLNNGNYRITLLNSDRTKISQCEIETGKLAQEINNTINQNTNRHNEEIAQINSVINQNAEKHNDDISQINSEISDINQALSGENTYNLLKNYTLALNPNYVITEQKYTHYTGDTHGTSIGVEHTLYNPDDGDILTVWADYRLLLSDTDYSVTKTGETLYVISFTNELPAGTNIILQIIKK